MADRRAAVTGGAGFIGSWVVDQYLEAGYEVLAIDVKSRDQAQHVSPRAAYAQVDLRDGDVERVLCDFRPDVVSHHAAQASVPGSVADPVHDVMTNVVGSVRLLEAARKSGVRKIVYAASGGSTYGAVKYLPTDEKHPIDPISPYAVSKHTVEHYLRAYQSLYGLQFTSLRYANIYGPRQDPHGEAGVVAIFTKRMLGGEQPIVNGEGTDERDYVFVRDVARANLLAVEQGDGAMVNIATGVGTTVIEIFDELKRLTEFPGERVHGPPRAGDVPSIRLDPDLAKETLGWEPSTSIRDGLRETVAWFIDQQRA
jgi:UDP-glucose 4-epimerase